MSSNSLQFDLADRLCVCLQNNLVLVTNPHRRSTSRITFNSCLDFPPILLIARLMVVDAIRVFTRLLTPLSLIKWIGYVFVCKVSSFY